MINNQFRNGMPCLRKIQRTGFLALVLFVSACQQDPVIRERDVDLPACATPYTLQLPDFFPPLPPTPGNPLTVEGIELGRRLFYEPLLSGDNTQSCASCHQQNASFVDGNKRLSIGIDGLPGFRNSMPLYNLAWAEKYFWDGNARSLEELALIPIEAEFEMHENLFRAVRELQEHPEYPGLFYRAFCDSTVNVERMAQAMAQFLRTILATSLKLAPGSVGIQSRSPQEERGYRVFLDETKGDCFHCHVVNAFNTNFEFINNGLNPDPTADPGLYGQTGDPNDLGKFKVPSLLNLKYTAPFMHDGRFSSLDEVLAFYDTGFHYSSTLDPNLVKHMDANRKPVPRKWTAQDKEDLKAFILSLEDDRILSNPAFSKP
ncbi:MAG: cytochrome-c peroxidase [Flavobacteriales bacterium]|nr:cytochrome-c peroxidase [Flavobacteriales bacterium]